MALNRTKIEWAQNPDGTPGYTWNPITGCLLRCEYCWAWKLANGRCRKACVAGHTMFETEGERLTEHCLDPFYPRLHRNRLYHPWDGKPRGIFTVSMGDLFGAPDAWIENIIDLARKHESNRYYFLTKQPQNLAKWSPFPDNCWVGVSATGYWNYVDACNYLSQIEAKVRYLSLEPLLSWDSKGSQFFKSSGLSWVILGAQTKPYIAPKVKWVEEIVGAADAASIPVFIKNSLWRLLVPKHGIPPAWAGGRNGEDTDVLRQEMPTDG